MCLTDRCNTPAVLENIGIQSECGASKQDIDVMPNVMNF